MSAPQVVPSTTYRRHSSLKCKSCGEEMYAMPARDMVPSFRYILCINWECLLEKVVVFNTLVGD